jgi:hypothetical protein
MAVPYKLNYFEIESGLGTTSTFLHKGDLTANRIIKIDGTSNDILLGDGSTVSLSGILGNYVPYTGATGAVNLGAYDLTVNGVNIGRGTGGLNSTNTVVGNSSLQNNTVAGANSAFGAGALSANTSGSSNTAVGYRSLFANTLGTENVSVGANSIYSNISGNKNVAIGFSSGRFIGSAFVENTTSSNSIYIGNDSRPSLDGNTNEIVVAYQGRGLGSNTTVLGNTSTVFGRWFGNLLIGDSVNSGQQLQVTGNMKLTGTLTNGTYTYTLPSNTGTLALTSDIPSLTGYVTLDTAQTITAAKTFSTSGSSDTLIINHSSGSGIALNITKGGNGEGLYINKTSGSGNAATIIGTLNATTLVKSGGTSSQYLMADGSVSTLTNPITGTGASGQVAFWNGTSTQTGSNNLFWDNTNGRLGIGTTTPAQALEVVGVSRLRSGIEIFNDSRILNVNSGGSIRFNTGGSISIANTSNVEYVRFNAGNVLIGTTTDAGFRLDVNGTARVQGITNITRNDNNANLSSLNITNTSTTGANSIRIGQDTSNNCFLFGWHPSAGTTLNSLIPNTSYLLALSGASQLTLNTTTASQPITFSTNNWNERMRIFGAGNVIIGGGNTPTDAGFRLDVNGTARVQGVLTTTADAVVNGVSVGRGAGNIVTNTRVGESALNANTTGSENTAIGRITMFSNTTGTQNTAVGVRSLQDNTTGSLNTSVGYQSGRFLPDGITAVTIANNSVFIGAQSRAAADNQTNQIVIGQTAIGLGSNTTVIGNSSTTFGRWYGNLLIGTSTNSTFALDVVGTARTTLDITVNGVSVGLGGGAITTNTRVGSNALINNTTGSSNVAVGFSSLIANTTGINNTSIGRNSMVANISGTGNTVVGNQALANNTTGGSNIVIGSGAARFIADGTTLNTITNNSLFIGALTKALEDNQTNQIVIGYNSTGLGSNTTVIGNSSTVTAKIFGTLEDTRGTLIAGALTAGQIAFGTAANTVGGDSGLFWDNTNKRLGIGIISPAGKLDIFDSILSSFYLRNSSIGANWFTTAVNSQIGTYTNHPFVLKSNDVTRLSILANGNVLINTTTDAGFRLDVNGTTRFNGLSTIQGTTASDTAPLGAELLTTGTGDASWTGTDFATGYTHVAGSTTTLTSTLAAVVNTFYQITYTVTGRTAGSFTISFGGFTSGALTATGATGPRATTTDTLVITPTSDFNGTIVLSIKTISVSSASVTFNSSSGVVTNQIRISNNNSNTFIGLNAGRNNTTAVLNSFFGLNAGQATTTGSSNSFFGTSAGLNNTIGLLNSFFGRDSGQSNTTGSNNSFFGVSSGIANTTGGSNSFFGVSAGAANTTGGSNSFFGTSSGQNTTTGVSNSFFGLSSGFNNTTGFGNSFFGQNSAFNISSGSQNTFIGLNAGRYAGSGTTAMTSVNNSIYLGYQTRGLNATGSTNEIVIGFDVVGLGSNTTVLGNSSTVTTALYGAVITGGTSADASAQLQADSTTKGFLPPRMTTTQKNAISSPATGLMVYDTTLNKLAVYTGMVWETITSI